MAGNGVVYHYCSLETFYSIITGKTLRLCEIDKSNDSRELTWIRDFIQVSFMEQFEAMAEKEERALPRWPFIEVALDAALEQCFGEQRPYNYLGACFSSRGDQLSQWRGYADDGAGVSIGFSRGALRHLAEEKKRKMDRLMQATPPNEAPPTGKVNYLQMGDYKPSERTAAGTGWIKDLALEAVAGMRKIRFEDKPGPDFDAGDAALSLLQGLIVRAFHRSPFYKNSGFSEEGEWRVLSLIPKPSGVFPFELLGEDEMTKVSCVVRGSKLLYYTVLPIHGHPKIIKKLMVGPKCGASVDDLAGALCMNGFQVELDTIDRSIVSYR